MTDDALTRSTPSDLGIDAAGIVRLIDRLESLPDVEPHSLMVLRHGRVAAEGWWAPYAPERPHLLYSLSKSFTSSAAGIAVAEGLFGLDDTIISHFPEFDAEVTDERTRRMTIRHLLAMSSGHRDETVERARELDPLDLVHGFLQLPPDEEPGTLFCYNQPCTYTVGAIIQRATGGTLIDYLEPRLLAPLGISRDEVGWISAPNGFQLGFSGFHAPTHAVAKLAQLYLQKGEWDGAQLVPADYVAEATRVEIDNAAQGGSPDWAAGYGYQFWIATHGYRGDGAYGQFAVVLPELDVVVAMTGQSIDMQAVLDAVWSEFLPAVDGTPGGAEADAALIERVQELRLPVPAAGTVLADAVYRVAPGSAVPGLVEVQSKGGALTLVDAGEPLRLAVGAGEWAVNEFVAASASAVADGAVQVDVAFLETPHRLVVSLDPAADTFTAAWATEPLHELTLAERRRPRTRVDERRGQRA